MRTFFKKELEQIQKGMIVFSTEDEELKIGTIGSGKVTYLEGSIYTGSLVFTGKSFEKLGYGRQDFSVSTISNDDIGGPIDDTVYLYEGMFDYRETGWIYGNGIIYFLKNGKPDAYYAGFFKGTAVVGEYTGPEIESVLLPEFRDAKKLDALYPKQSKIKQLTNDLKKYKSIDYLFIGDSYFDNLNFFKDENEKPLFEKYKKDNNAFNMGIGGWRYVDFLPYIDKLVIPSNPQNLIVNLGFNDMHFGKDANDTLKDMEKFLNPILSKLPDIKIYLLTVCHFPAFPHCKKEEEKYNEEIKRRFKDNGNITVIDSSEVFEKIKKKGLNITDYIEPDLIHPNNKGYEKWMPYILKRVEGYKY